MPAVPSPTIYHRWLGWHAPAVRRLVVASSIGLTVGLVLLAPATWELALIAGWNASALVFLIAVGPIIARADGPRTGDLATREDETRGTAGLLLLGASPSPDGTGGAPRRRPRAHSGGVAGALVEGEQDALAGGIGERSADPAQGG